MEEPAETEAQPVGGKADQSETVAKAGAEQQPQQNEPTKKASSIGLALLGGGLGGVLVTAAVSVWLFYAKWPVERAQMLAETRKAVEEAAQAKAQTEQAKVQTGLGELEESIRKIDTKYHEQLRALEVENKKLGNSLAAIDARTKERRDQNDLALGDTQASKSSAEVLEAVTPHVSVDCTIRQDQPYILGSSSRVIVNLSVTNGGSHEVWLSPSFSVKSMDDSAVYPQPLLDGEILPRGNLAAGRQSAGRLSFYIPQEWIALHFSKLNVHVIFTAITKSDVIDTYAQKIGDKALVKRLVANSSREVGCLAELQLKSAPPAPPPPVQAKAPPPPPR